MYDFNRILVPMDLSQCSEKALGVGLTLAGRVGGSVVLLYAQDSRPGSRVYEDNEATDDTIDEIENVEGALRHALERVAAKVAETGPKRTIPLESVEICVGAGGAADEILRVAEEVRADLIVMGTHGRTRVRDLFVGSTTERVFRNATCAVMGVKPDGYPFLRD